jgi:antitoxin (DNA-binding transcriptional repressor) of toxin-antitoxin stability system
LKVVQTVGAYEAKTKLPALLERVSKGESFTITRHGIPIAMLTKPMEDEFPDAKKAIEDLLGTRHKFARAFEGLDYNDIKAMMEEGRK